MKLIDAKSKRELSVGDETLTFRGEVVIITGISEPKHPGSTGRVYLKGRNGKSSEFFPGVIGAEWIE